VKEEREEWKKEGSEDGGEGKRKKLKEEREGEGIGRK